MATGVPRLTQEQRTAASKQRLLRAAVELAAEKGWARTTNAEISRRAGFSGAMVNVRFGSREALLDVMLRTYEARFTTGTGATMSGLDELLGRSETLRREAADDPAFLRAFLRVCFETVGSSTDLLPLAAAWFERYVGDLTAVVETGQIDGSIRRDVSAAAEAQAFLDANAGACFSWILRPADVDFDDALAKIASRTRRWLQPAARA